MLRIKVVQSNSGALGHALRALVGVQDRNDLLSRLAPARAQLDGPTGRLADGDERRVAVRRRQAVLTHGGYAYAKEYHFERYLREVMISRLAPISPELIQCIIAEKVLGLPNSY